MNVNHVVACCDDGKCRCICHVEGQIPEFLIDRAVKISNETGLRFDVENLL
jgi:hypothetical protein